MVSGNNHSGNYVFYSPISIDDHGNKKRFGYVIDNADI